MVENSYDNVEMEPRYRHCATASDEARKCRNVSWVHVHTVLGPEFDLVAE